MTALCLLLALGVATAAEPVVQRHEDSRIEGYVGLSAPPETVFAVVSDPAEVARIDGSTQVETTPDVSCGFRAYSESSKVPPPGR